MVVFDIDGTITQSNIRGFLLPLLGLDRHHRRVVELLDKVNRQGYIITYLTARPLALSEVTRKYLFKVKLQVIWSFPLREERKL